MKLKKIISTLLIITMIFCMTFTHFAENNDQNIDELIVNAMYEIETEPLVKDVNDIVNEDTDKEKNDELENENNEDNKNVINSDEALLESEAEVNKSIELIEESYEIKETEESTKIEETEDVKKAENAEEIEAIETTNDIDEIISTISNINSTSDDGKILKMATISEVEIFSDALTPWMWWYLTDDGHTIHYSSIEPVDGGHSVNTSPIIYEGLAKEDITRAVIDDAINMQTGYEFFKDFNNLIEIENTNNLDTSNVINMDSMFSGCVSLTSLDLSNFDTRNVTTMSYMFSNCSSLSNLDLSGFDTSSVAYMLNMFYKCSSLVNLDLNGFNTENTVDMYGMFNGCSSLVYLNVSGFNTSNVTNMSYMFNNCSSISSLDLSNFDTRNITYMSSMFSNCASLTSLNVTNFDTTNVRSMSSMFSGCILLTSLDVSSFFTTNVHDMEGMFSGCASLISLDLSNFDTNNVTRMLHMFNHCNSLTNLNLTGFDTNNVTRMDRMFYKCSSLVNLDLSGFNTENVTNMENMFANCSSLINLNLNSFNTRNVTSMQSMFSDCSSLTNIDMSNFNTSSVIHMGNMFYKCRSLTSLDLSNFDTSNVTIMLHMFSGCSSLVSLDVSNFNTSNVNTMAFMFDGCSSLLSIDLSSFDISNVVDMQSMFSNCSSIVTLNLSNFASNANDLWLKNMFDGCSSLEELDLSSFNVLNSRTTDNMIAKCPSLQILKISESVASIINTTCKISYDWKKQGETTIYYYDNEHKKTTIPNASGTYVRVYDVDRVAVIFESNGGNFVYAQTVNVGSTIIEPTKPAKEDYLFLGWYDETLTNQFDFTTIVNSNMTLYAKWQTVQMTMTYWYIENGTDLHLSSIEPASTNYVSGQEFYKFDVRGTDIPWREYYDDITKVVFDNQIQVAYCRSLFKGLKNIIEFVNINNFDTSQCIDMSCMFLDCSSLTSLDLSRFNTKNVTNMSNMFAGCRNLVTIYANEDFATCSLAEEGGINTGSYHMFYNCLSLKGGHDTIYDSSHTDKEYARVDTEDSHGYFTYKEVPTPSYRTLSNILVVKLPNVISYVHGATLNPTGLIIKLIYSDGTVENITYNDENSNNFEFNPTLATKLTTNQKIVTVIYEGLTAKFDINVSAHRNEYNKPNNSGSSSSGGSGDKVFKNIMSPTNYVNSVKNIKRAIDATQISWEYNQVLNKWRMNIRIGEQMVPVEEGFYLVAGLNYQNINVMGTNLIGSDTYYFDKDGYMLTGWIHTIDNKWYYMRHFKDANEGKMVFGWYQIDNKWYYFATDGSMLVNTITPDGYIVGIDGAWVPSIN